MIIFWTINNPRGLIEMNRKGIEFGFNWIFAIIAGAIILFSAIYITTKLVGTERRVSDTFIATELDNLLHPIETNLENSKYATIKFVDETRVYNDCLTVGAFGKQQISTASKLGIGDEWGVQSVRKTSYNKYVFSRAIEEGKKMHAIVKPFEMPFKIGDLTMLYGKNYCFVNPPSDLEDEINDLSGNGANNIGINMTSNLNDCLQGSETVCFGNQLGCDVLVNTFSKIVSKNELDVYYEGDSLMLAAILSDSLIYECQFARLMKRAGELGHVYLLKSNYLGGIGCANNLGLNLQDYILSVDVNRSRDLSQVIQIANTLGGSNEDIARCKVF